MVYNVHTSSSYREPQVHDTAFTLPPVTSAVALVTGSGEEIGEQKWQTCWYVADYLSVHF